MPEVHVEIDGDVTIYNVGDDADLAEYIAEICQEAPNAETEVVDV